jgi:ubiquitin-protein ligase
MGRRPNQTGIQGPEGTPYEAGVFRLELELSER